MADRFELEISYAIGIAKPISISIETYGTGKVSDEILAKYIMKNFDMRPKALIEELDLLRPGYRRTAAYGHFGRSEFTWEKTTRAAKLAADLLKPANGVSSSAKKKTTRKGGASATA